MRASIASRSPVVLGVRRNGDQPDEVEGAHVPAVPTGRGVAACCEGRVCGVPFGGQHEARTQEPVNPAQQLIGARSGRVGEERRGHRSARAGRPRQPARA